ncbi:hypothetical protein SLS60_004862 [Paraconiothyrium brasiliense]|uniref:SGNH hydrolase-type esterase domain-containing protein n=1 Tax=Paraconiothyrium brasiliense TaxID=300254 RepID=A0ABR3RLK2_9PLEO
MLNFLTKLVPCTLLSFFASPTISSPLNTRSISSTPLRILPLGDSITWGYFNGTGTNGYREELLERLVAIDASVEFVGTQTSGNMTNNQNEGHPGWTINQVRAVLGPALDFKPNVVLIHLATNDLNMAETAAESWSEAPERLGGVIDDVVKALPDAAVFVAKIIQTKIAESQKRFDAYNAAIPGVVKERVDKGFGLVVVDQSVVGTDELSDDLHPDPAGYAHMGNIWADAVLNNQALVKPVPS